MNYPKGFYFNGVVRGLQSVLAEVIKLQDLQCKHKWNNSVIKNAVEESSSTVNETFKELSKLDSVQIEKNISEIFQRSSMVFEGLSAVIKHTIVNVREKQVEDDLSIPEEFSLNNDLSKNYSLNLQFSIENTRPSLDERNKIEAKMEQSFTASNQNLQYIGNNSELDSDTSQIHTSEPIQNCSKNDTTNAVNTDCEHVSTKSEFLHENMQIPGAKLPTDMPIERIPKKLPSLSEKARERAVPASRMARVISFGTLAAGLGLGTMAEMTRRTFGISNTTTVAGALDNPFVTPANVERIVNTLCKVRGAALKIGQILSIQDNDVISPEFQKLFERVRQSADFMPTWQVEDVMKNELGADWKSKFKSFEMKPFAAASIGQVHAATLIDDREVAIKIQYPGVAKGIESDIDNLMSVMKIWNVFPHGMFVDNLVEVAKKELSWEVDYVREAECTKKFKKLLEPYPEYYVPEVIEDLCTARVFTTELIEGVPVDKCADMDDGIKCHISMLIQNLVLKEMFVFRFMQTDPNWSNFFYNPNTRQMILLDFGASRSYDKKFMDQYLRVVKSAIDGDRSKVLHYSEKMGFLTGYESKIMQDAHVDAVMILGEILRTEGFDFSEQNTVGRIQALAPTIIHHRLCPPPEEIYSLHRKLSGAFLLYTKLKTKLSCHNIFMQIYNNYEFTEE